MHPKFPSGVFLNLCKVFCSQKTAVSSCNVSYRIVLCNILKYFKCFSVCVAPSSFWVKIWGKSLLFLFFALGKHAASQTPYVQCQSPPIPLVSEDSLKDYKEFKGGKWDRKTYKIVIAYDGSAFAGWQRQPALHTVQGYNIVGFHEVLLCYGVGKWKIVMILTTNLCYRVLEQALGKFCDGKKAASLKCEGLSVEAVVTVAGRTDKGVHAAGQVCSFCKLTVSFFYNFV